MNTSNIPIDVRNLLPKLEQKFLELIESLSDEDWQKPTIAKLWTVKDVVAHLLDGNIRVLSVFRDNYYGESPNISSQQDLLNFLNQLNADWVKAMKRVSPEVLILLHKATGRLFNEYLASVDLFATSKFAVDWAGESESKMWMEIARQYTEKWLHQQQIRYALHDETIMTKEFFYPFISIFMMALPHTYRDVPAEEGTVIRVTVSTEIGGAWYLNRRNNSWVLEKNMQTYADASLEIDPHTSWKLFSKSLRAHEVKEQVRIEGNESLAAVALQMISVMA